MPIGGKGSRVERHLVEGQVFVELHIHSVEAEEELILRASLHFHVRGPILVISLEGKKGFLAVDHEFHIRALSVSKEIKPVRKCVGSAGEDKPPLLVQKGGIYHLISTAEVIAHIHHRVVPIVYLQSNLIGRFLSGIGRHRQHHCQQSQECKFVSTKRPFHIQL